MRLILVLIVVLVAVVFAAQNATPVTIDLFFWRIDSSLAVVIASCFAIGIIAGILFAVPSLYRMRSHRRRLQAQLAEAGGGDAATAESESAPVSSSGTRGRNSY